MGKSNSEKSKGRAKLKDVTQKIKLEKLPGKSGRRFWCSAQNALGEQTDPCSILVLPEGSSRQIVKCSPSNVTTDGFNLICSRVQIPRVLVIQDTMNKTVLKTILDKPVVQVSKLRPDTRYYIYLYANESRDPFQSIQLHTLGAPVRQLETRAETNEKRGEDLPTPEPKKLTKIVGGVAGICTSVILAILISIVVYKVRLRKCTSGAPKRRESAVGIHSFGGKDRKDPQEEEICIQTNV